MAKVSVTIWVPEWSVAQLQQAVHDLDEVESGEGNGILLEHVDAKDILTAIFCGSLGAPHEVINSALTDD